MFYGRHDNRSPPHEPHHDHYHQHDRHDNADAYQDFDTLHKSPFSQVGLK